jgi:transcription antitermination factor NusG
VDFGSGDILCDEEDLSPNQKKPKFKIGDRVKVTNDGDDYNGQVGKIHETKPNDVYLVDFEGYPSSDWFMGCNLEKVDEPALSNFKKGDRVRVRCGAEHYYNGRTGTVMGRGVGIDEWRVDLDRDGSKPAADLMDMKTCELEKIENTQPTKFKVGDRVRVIRGSPFLSVKGWVGTVLHKDERESYIVEFRDKVGKTDTFPVCAKYLEKANK